MFLITFVIAPAVGIISQFALGIEPWPMGVVIFLLGFGGLLRIAYALMFESKYPPALPAAPAVHVTDQQLPGQAQPTPLPSHQTYPASQYVSPETERGLSTQPQEPHSVTESTTRLLEKEPEPPE
jgi:hypothetical protein